MQNVDLASDYVDRAEIRLRALDVLFEAGSWADVVREFQEVVELALKGLLRGCGIDPPRVHEVSGVLVAEQARLPEDLRERLETLTGISRELRRRRFSPRRRSPGRCRSRFRSAGPGASTRRRR